MSNELPHLGLNGEERRNATRFECLPDDEFAVMWVDGEQPQLVEVHDESLHGISLILDDDCGIGIGTRAHIVYAGVCHLAQARHVEPLSSRKLLIGFQCELSPEVIAPA